MKSWMLILSVAAAIVLPGGILIAAGVWLRRRWLQREARAIDALIVPPVPRSGEPVEERIRLVRK